MQTDTGHNRSRAWKMETLTRMRNLRSGESVDILTGADWDEGIATKNRTGVSTIHESISGDDITDWARFQVNVPVQVNTDNAISAIVNSSCSVVVDSSDAYSSNLTTFCSRESIFSSSAPSLLLALCLPRS